MCPCTFNFVIQGWVLVMSLNNCICPCTFIFGVPRFGAQDVIQQLAYAYAAYGFCVDAHASFVRSFFECIKASG